MDTLKVQRTLVTYGILVPVVLLMGYFVGAPTGAKSYFLLAILFMIMTIPLLMSYHHILLAATWNAAFTLGFISTSLYVWHAIAVVSLILTMMDRIVHRRPLISYRPLTYSILFLIAAAIGTGLLRGGIGMRVLGSSMYGGKTFATLIAAAIGFFALSWVRVPKRQVLLYVALYFLASLTLIFSNIIYYLGRSFWWLYMFIPPDYAYGQAIADVLNTGVQRIGGVGFALTGVFSFMMVRYGIQGIFDLTKPWRLILYFAVIIGSLFGGFRSTVILYILFFISQFFLEGLHKTKYFWGILLGGAIFLGFLYPMAKSLPVSYQRSLSFLPGIKIDQEAKNDADASVEWRLKIWSVLWPQVGDYLMLGKGFVYDSSDVYLAEESMKRGFIQSEDFAITTGDYHSGPLSILIPLGIWGFIAFLLINIFGLRMLYLQFRYGNPDLYMLNLGLLALFTARLIFFWFFFGAIATELYVFLGILGLSLSVNGTPRKTPWVPEEDEEQADYAELGAAGITPNWTPAWKPTSISGPGYREDQLKVSTTESQNDQPTSPDSSNPKDEPKK